ncbi:hypothetical protein LTR73_009134 [Friedmanniomyces endolithicus]|nr:hypothetical protein LTR73_009134 [Friedmanniomyces endolithicus]
MAELKGTVAVNETAAPIEAQPPPLRKGGDREGWHTGNQVRQISSEETLNQLHAQDLLDPAVVRIPRIHAHFQTNGVHYVVMKYVDGEKRESIRDLAMIRTIAGIVNYKHTFTRDIPGPVNGGACYGPLWSEDDRSALPTKEHLEDYVNSGLIRNVGKFTVATTPMVFTHLDISARNLLIKGSCVWLLDWEFAGYFPRSAEIATLRLDLGKDPANWTSITI